MTKTKEKTEAQIQAEILAAIGSFKGIQVMRINTGVFHDADGVRRIRSVDKGTHDILCCVQINMKRVETVDSGSMQFQLPRYYTFGQLVWLEVKMPDKYLNPDQIAFGNAWQNAGAIEKANEKSKELEVALAGMREKNRKLNRNLANEIKVNRAAYDNCVVSPNIVQLFNTSAKSSDTK